MNRVKLFAIAALLSAAVASCGGSPLAFSIADSKEFDASLFRQHCAICHGHEGLGRVLDDGIKVPSLRSGEFKAVTRAQIHAQITNGGNGMLPFREQLTERERQLLSDLVYHRLRGN